MIRDERLTADELQRIDERIRDEQVQPEEDARCARKRRDQG